MALQFLQYLNSCYRSIQFTHEFEENDSIAFLDVLVKKEGFKFSTNIFRKKTFTGLYTRWDSFMPRKYEISLVRTLTYRYLRIFTSSELLESSLSRIERPIIV